MKNINDIFFFIQARTGSTRVPNKMLKPFVDSSLFEIAVKKMLKSSMIPKDNFYLSIMDDELFDIAKKYDVKTFKRSEESVQEPVTLQKVFEWHDKVDYKYFVFLNACNPILSVKTIDKFIKSFIKSDSDGMFGVFEKKTFLFDSNHKMMNDFYGDEKYFATLETKFVETTYEAAHSLYAGKIEDIGKDIYMGTFKEKGSPEFFVMDEIECFDIDWPFQFDVAETMYKQRKDLIWKK
jgi:CMP-N-acetylneuraminic acid synthetase|tara:strand:+ start:1030 stop:1740 length:711 start_codon:yes stop_codon:yes gene_type:complete